MSRRDRNTLQILAPLRHACQACGMSCQGIHVWLTPEERVSFAATAARLGVPDIVEDNRLSFKDGRCPFLMADGLCRVHAELGFEAKPLICRQYPLVMVRTEDGIRAGMDPGCFQTWKTWRNGPSVTPGACAVERRLLEPPQYQQEQGLLDLLEVEDLNLARVACLLAGRPGETEDGLPLRLAHRIVERLQAAPLAHMLSRSEAGDSMGRALAPLLQAIPTWDPEAPPPWPPPRSVDEGLGIEMIRRMIFLRIGATHPTPMHSAVLMLVGAIACAWAEPAPHLYGPALSGWSRAIRAEALWKTILPKPESLMWMARGYTSLSGPQPGPR